MSLCFSGKIFNKSKNLTVLENGDIFWSLDERPFSWSFLGNLKKPQIFQVFDLFEIDMPDIIKPERLKTFSSLGVDLDSIPLSLVQPQEEFRERLQEVIDKSLEAIRMLSATGYDKTFYLEQEVLLMMNSAKYDYQSAKKYFEKNNKKVNESVLKTFKTSSGFLKPSVYCNTSTLTGRMTIKSGPQILTAPKEMRNFILPSSSKNLIAQADFISLEPRLGKLLAGGNPEKDVYSSIGNSVFSGKLNREQVKKALLPAIYGAGHRTLSSMLPSDIKAKDVIAKLRDYLNFDEIVAQKKEELKQTGQMKNYFGRPVVPSSDRDTTIYNNWLQSSAVSASLLGFKKFLETFDCVSPLFLIHDAIIFEIPKIRENEIKNFLNSGIEIDNIGNFPMTYLLTSG